MVNRLIPIFSLYLLSLILTPIAHSAVIEVTTDRSIISVNESFQLHFTATETPDEDPDFSLLKNNFTILNQHKNSQMSWKNGAKSKTIQWTLNLMAEHHGQIMIPSIPFGDDSSKPLIIKINDTVKNVESNQSGDELFLTVEVDKKQSYVQSQVLYTVRFYQRVNILQASLSEPDIDNTVIENLTEENLRYKTQIKDVVYLVTERQYALFPQQSGSITIEPLILQAQIEVQSSQPRSPMDNFFAPQNTKTIKLSSDPVTLDILPLPASIKDTHWLPAKNVQLTQTWSNDDLHVNVGEPITRTITLKAQGITSSQLPELPLTQNKQLKTYPDQAIRHNDKEASGITSTLQQKTALIPSQAGQIELPALSIPWFNVHSQKTEIAQLPATIITAIATINNEPTTSPLTPLVEEKIISTPAPNNASPPQSSTWMWLALFLGLGWLITLTFIAWARYQTEPKQNLAKKQPITNSKHLLKTLQQTCNENDPHATHKALLAWAKEIYGTNTLGELNNHSDSALKTELAQLNHSLYAKTPLSWDGSTLFDTLSNNQLPPPLNDDNNKGLDSLHLL